MTRRAVPLLSNWRYFRNSPGRQYQLEVRAFAEGNGNEVECVQTVTGTAGQSCSISFTTLDFEPLPRTGLIVHLTHDGQLTLAGNSDDRSGDVRIFSTSELAAGETWAGYRVVAKWNATDRSSHRKRSPISLPEERTS